MKFLSFPLLASWAFAGTMLLKDSMTEAEARAALQPVVGNLMTLEAGDMEMIISKQWFKFAQEIIVKSHEQGADLSFSVRKGVQKLKNEADELVRALNPKYGIAQLVNPSFRWAQNETSIFINVKFSARWNAPGALEVSDAVVNFTRSTAFFTGLGQHSNNKYKYVIDLKPFDALIPEACIWSASSVGKLSITLRKKWPRKWPRLLADKKLKISNMALWMEYQEDFPMESTPAAQESPLSCAHLEKFYCLSTDRCVDEAKCGESCKPDYQPVVDSCIGSPSSEGTVTFTDTNMQEGVIAGKFEIAPKEKTAYDIDEFELYWSNPQLERLELITKVNHIPGEKAYRSIKDQKPKSGHVLVVAKNSKGELHQKEATKVEDAYLPLDAPLSISFNDTDIQADYITGFLEVILPPNPTFTHVVAHWARSKTRKISGDSEIVSKEVTVTEEARAAGSDAKNSLTVLIPRKKIESGAKYFHVYAKNQFGENPQPLFLKIEDQANPCAYGFRDTEDCLKEGAIKVSEDVDEEENRGTFTVSITAAPSVNVTDYVVYFGKTNCEDGDATKVGAQIGTFDSTLPKDATVWEKTFEQVIVPIEATAVLVYPWNKNGESSNCQSADFFDKSPNFDFAKRKYAKLAAAVTTRGSRKKEMEKMLQTEFGFTGKTEFVEVMKFIESDVLVDPEKNKNFLARMKAVTDEQTKKEAESKDKKDKKDKKNDKKKEKKKNGKQEL